MVRPGITEGISRIEFTGRKCNMPLMRAQMRLKNVVVERPKREIQVVMVLITVMTFVR